MKPYLTIKTVKGKKYIQISDIRGDIHIGPANKIDTWSVAYQALQDSYVAFSLEELLALKGIADEEGISLLVALDIRTKDSEKWKAFRDKQVQKRMMHYVTRQLLRGFDINDPQILEGLNELDINLQAHEKTGRIVGVSPECIEMTERLVKLYEEKTEK